MEIITMTPRTTAEIISTSTKPVESENTSDVVEPEKRTLTKKDKIGIAVGVGLILIIGVVLVVTRKKK